MSLLGGTLLFRNFKVIIPVKPREEVVRERKVTCLAATHVTRGAHFACILLKKERPKHSRLLFLCKRSNLWSIFLKIKNDNKNNTAIGTILIMVVIIQNDARFLQTCTVSSNRHRWCTWQISKEIRLTVGLDVIIVALNVTVGLLRFLTQKRQKLSSIHHHSIHKIPNC